jgi:hypothetical protein
MLYRSKITFRFFFFFILILIGFAKVQYDFIHRLNRIEKKLLLNENEGSFIINQPIHLAATPSIVEMIPQPKINEPAQVVKKRFVVFECKSLCGGWADRLKGLKTYLKNNF